MHSAFLLDLPLTPYREALGLQHRCVEARRAGQLEHDLLILLEHPPVFTLGRRGGRDNLLVAQAELDQQGIEVVPIERGGDITYHGPGQLVAYFILDLNAAHLGVRPLVAAMESAMVLTAADWGVTAAGNPDFRGVWVGKRKLGSIGITIRRGITFHGLALNVNTDLSPFAWINPCGIAGCTMTSLARETGSSVLPMDLVRRRIAGHLAAEFDLDLIKAEMDSIDERINL
jgi:lipoate-protein ligase B